MEHSSAIKVGSSSGLASGAGLNVMASRDTPGLARAYDELSVRQFVQGKILISALEISRGEHVLDIGAGTGNLAMHVAKIVGPSGFVVGIDPLPLRVEIARSKAADNFTARIGCAEDLSAFTDSSFDVVYLNSVFHWVADKPRALTEIFRVLKPHGRLGLTCPDPTHPHESHRFIRRALEAVGAESGDCGIRAATGLVADELEKHIVLAGFIDYSSELRTIDDTFPDIDTLLVWMESSSFGKFFADMSPRRRDAMRDALSDPLSKTRTPDGLCLRRYLRFATMRKPLNVVRRSTIA
jgi:arsenite methyltransferase